MSKRAINYIKPQDPSFLAKLKAEIGYKEGPNVDTKRAKLDAAQENAEQDLSDSEAVERSDEQPQIVVLKAGDLTADQVAAEKQRLDKEKATAKADLSQPITFKKKSNKSTEEILKKQKKTKKGAPEDTKLSFSYSDEENA